MKAITSTISVRRTAARWIALFLVVVPVPFAMGEDRGSGNTGDGAFALYVLNGGFSNTGIGYDSLRFLTTGSYNVAVGYQSLDQTNGSQNCAVGFQAMFSSTTGGQNAAVGMFALFGNTTGGFNTATGKSALQSNATGSFNTASGAQALCYATGHDNSALGSNALFNLTTGIENTASGSEALYQATGNDNSALGFSALFNLTTGSNNVALGSNAGSNLTIGSNNIVIGANVVGNATDANVTRIGNSAQKKTFIGGIYNKIVANGVGVMVNSSGQLGTVQSSARYKTAIKPMAEASAPLLALKPVTFRYKDELDPEKVPQFGLIAEDVAKVDPDLVVRGENGQVTTVRYEAVNSMLLNEFLKEHAAFEKQQVTVRQQETAITQLRQMIAEERSLIGWHQKQIEALTVGLQKVGAAVEVKKTSPIRLTESH